MEVSGFNINLTSDQPEALAAFYRDVIQLPPDPDIGGRPSMSAAAPC